MHIPLHILHLEDDEVDARLVQSALGSGGVAAELTTVSTRSAFEHALEQEQLDAILADYRLPGFDGLKALALARARRPEVPFLFFTGALGEERAVETLKSGATDFVLKQNLARVVPALLRAVSEAAERVGRQEAEASLRESEERRRLDAEVVRAIEHERGRLCQELHEGVAQSLTGIAGLMAAARSKIKRPLPESVAELQEILELVKLTVSEVRELANGFYPVELEDVGLLTTLQGLAAKASNTHDLSCRVESTLPEGVLLKGPVAIQLFRIAQEGLRNAIQHAKPSQVLIRLDAAGDNIILTVRDDGIGFPAQAAERGGIGLRIMQHRARLCEGKLEVRNGPAGGAMIVCSVPCSKENWCAEDL